MRRLFVGNLSFNTTESGLRSAFESIGDVKEVKLLTDPVTNRSRWFGFVEMQTDDEAKRAIENLHKSELDGRTINVDYAKERQSSGSSYAGSRYAR